MPIKGKGYEILITRTGTQTGKVGAVTRTRTVGTYQVFHDGKPVSGLAGATFEQKGPGDNTKNGSNLDLCVAAGRYPLWTQDGTKFKTINYKKTPKAATGPTIKPRPGIELKETGARREVLIHPGLLVVGGVHSPLPPARKRKWQNRLCREPETRGRHHRRYAELSRRSLPHQGRKADLGRLGRDRREAVSRSRVSEDIRDARKLETSEFRPS